jgi:hypothetical protein
MKDRSETSEEKVQNIMLWTSTSFGLLLYLGLIIFALHNIFRYLRKQANPTTLLIYYSCIIFVCISRCVCLGTIIGTLIIQQENAPIIFVRSYWVCRELILVF